MGDKMQEVQLKVHGLDCSEEVAILEKVLSKRVEGLDFDVLKAKMRIRYNPEKIGVSEMIELIASTGMKAVLWEKRGDEGFSFLAETWAAHPHAFEWGVMALWSHRSGEHRSFSRSFLAR